MNLMETIKCLAVKHGLLTLCPHEASVTITRASANLNDFVVVLINARDEAVFEIVNRSLPLVDSRKTLTSADEYREYLEQYSKMNLCSGFHEKYLKTDVALNDIVIFYDNCEFRARSRKCTSLKNGSLCDECIKLSTNTPPDLSNSTENNHRCNFCNEVARTKNELSKHIRKCHKNAFKCTWDNCDKHFGSKADLDLHMKRHLKEFHLFCDICHKGFVSLRELKLHKVCHQSLRSYICFECGKLFLRKSNLNEHMKIHSEVKNFKCDICDASFSRPGNLQTHVTRKHGGDGGKRFGCPTCGKKFHAAQQLTRHLRVHTGERPFQCDRCVTSFARKDHLKKHKLKLHKVGMTTNFASNQNKGQGEMGSVSLISSIVYHEVPSPSEADLVIQTDQDGENANVSHIQAIRRDNPKPTENINIRFDAIR
eukprot:TRINITY_DN15637_c0_g1_i8.p1 TRINITY_DN15637_c0_g1~~TRINITY_DN15637_c0_g1_i8.p1  ORF type:complete len:425 (-),score=22.69 TRINITY_DN15637_c0_g1_i8:118-1392(-)